MKQQHFLFLATLFIVSCTFLNEDDMRKFLPGMYVRIIDHEFAKGSDTLVITLINSNTYQIVKRSGFSRIRNGKKQPVEQQTENWTGVYDEKEQVLRESRKGKALTPLPKENKLLVEASLYDKIID